MDDARAALKLYYSEREEWEKSIKMMKSFGATPSFKSIWETFKADDWTHLTDMRVRLVGQIASVHPLRNVTFFNLRGDRVYIQVIDKNRTQKLEKGQIVGVAGKIVKGKKGFPLVSDSDITILAGV